MDETRQVQGCCPLDCPDTCSWTVTVEDGRVAGVEGAKEHPITRGVLCAKVRDYEARQVAPDRLLHPLRRVGAKGEGRFERISWDEALDAVAGTFRRIGDTHGAEALLSFFHLGTMGVVQRLAPQRLFHALGATRLHGDVCGWSSQVLLGEGHPVGVDPEAIGEAELILLWGVNLLSTGHHLWHFIEQARKTRGARVIAIDPRATRTAKACDQHLAIVPGSDAVLAAAMGRVLLHEGLADLELAGFWIEDLEAYRAAVEPWTPERAAAATGIAAATIVELARAFGRAKPALIRAGMAPQQTAQGEAFVRGLSALAILGGHWRRPGGGLSILTLPDVDGGRAARPDLLPRGEATRSLHIAQLGAILDDETLAPPIRGLMVWCSNPAVSQIDAERLRRRLASDELFLVVHDQFLTDTARYADIVLPATTQFEHFDLLSPWGHFYLAINEAAVPPAGEAVSGGELMRRLAARLGLEHPALRESDEEIAAAALPPGWTLDELRQAGWKRADPLPRPAVAPLATRLRLAVEPIAAPPAPPPDTLQLLTPKSHYFLNSTFANMPRQRRSQGRPTVEMHPDDAGRRALKDGDAVVLRSGERSLETRVKVTATIRPGALVLEGKWWDSPAETAALSNRLTPSRWSPQGQPAYNETFVTVEPVAAPAPRELETAAE